MKCKEVQDNLMMFLKNETEDSVTEAVSSHLEQCSVCHLEENSLRSTLQLMNRLEEMEPSGHLWDRLEKQIDSERQAPAPAETGRSRVVRVDRMSRQSGWMRRAAAIAASILILAGILFITYSSSDALEVTIQSVAQDGTLQPGKKQNISNGFDSENSIVQVTLADGSYFRLNQNTRISYAQNEIFELESGQIFANIVSRKGKASFLINTPTAKIEVTGTEFFVKVDSRETELSVVEGTVYFRSRDKQQKRLVADLTTSTVAFASDKIPSEPRPFNIDDTFQWAGFSGDPELAMELELLSELPLQGEPVVLMVHLKNLSGASALIRPRNVTTPAYRFEIESDVNGPEEFLIFGEYEELEETISKKWLKEFRLNAGEDYHFQVTLTDIPASARTIKIRARYYIESKPDEPIWSGDVLSELLTISLEETQP